MVTPVTVAVVLETHFAVVPAVIFEGVHAVLPARLLKTKVYGSARELVPSVGVHLTATF